MPFPALRQVLAEQLAPDASPVEYRVHEKQSDVAPICRQDAQEAILLPGCIYCQAL